jgi:hypothetical protein
VQNRIPQNHSSADSGNCPVFTLSQVLEEHFEEFKRVFPQKYENSSIRKNGNRSQACTEFTLSQFILS